jgi:hypothetical protein
MSGTARYIGERPATVMGIRFVPESTVAGPTHLVEALLKRGDFVEATKSKETPEPIEPEPVEPLEDEE